MSSEILLLNRAGEAVSDSSIAAVPLGGSDPFGRGREIAWSGSDGLAAGRVRFEGELEVPGFPHIEMLVVVDGRLRLSAAGEIIDLPVGAGAVIARGTALHVRAEPGTRWAFCATTAAGSAAPGVRKLPSSDGLVPSAPPPAEALIGAAPQCRACNGFTDETAGFRAGLWDSTPYQRMSRPHRINELMHLTAGSVSLTSADGRITHVRTGDTVFVSQGTECAWDSCDHVEKFYVVHESRV